MPARQVWTIGHSNRDIATFIELLKTHGISQVADVRRFAGSRRQPQFGSEPLEQSLRAQEIGYRHLAALGGRRRRSGGPSPNTGWRVESFNAYADFMATNEFELGLEELMAWALRRPTTLMCAEALPWRCHRRLIADALVARGWQVLDILSPRPAKPHELTPFAHVDHGSVTYPGDMAKD
jgi:uncharacterized protein (DUF488 family)